MTTRTRGRWQPTRATHLSRNSGSPPSAVLRPATFNDVLTNAKANDTASDFIRTKIKAIVKDPKVAEMLTPRDHGFATKRPPIDTNYFETFNRDNVLLVDLKAEPIVEITETGIKTTEKEYPLDIIVFATGFDALTGPLLSLNIK